MADKLYYPVGCIEILIHSVLNTSTTYKQHRPVNLTIYLVKVKQLTK